MNRDCKARSRSRTKYSLSTGYCDLYYSTTGYVKSDGPYDKGYQSDSIQDVVCKNFSKRLARGEVINNPCDFWRTTVDESKDGSIRGTNTGVGNNAGDWFEWTGPITARYLGVVSPESPWDGIEIPSPNKLVMKEDAKLKALANIDKSNNAFGEDIGEIKQTIRFMKNPIGSLLQVGRAFKKTYRHARNSGSYKDLAAAHAAVWLQYRFALMPLIRSCSDLHSELMSNAPKLPKRQTASGFASRFSGIVPSQEITMGSVDSNYKFTIQGEMEVSCHASLLYEHSNPINDWKKRYGLRAKDIPHTLWQLVPYSFVVDRALDISSSISALTNFLDPDIKILAGSVTFRERDDRTTSLTGATANPTHTFTVSESPRQDNNFAYKRELWSPMLSDIIPPFKPKGLVDDALKVADDLALFTQLIAK